MSTTISPAALHLVTSQRLQGAWPLVVLLTGYPLWWLGGFQMFLWPLTAMLALGWLVTNRRTAVLPPGYALWLLFLVWVIASALVLSSPRYAAAWFFRMVLYTSVVIIGILVFNLLRRGLAERRLVSAVTFFWAAAVVMSLPGLALGTLELTSPTERLLPAAVLDQPFIQAIVHPSLSTLDSLYGVARPSPLFAYTNEWGAAMGVLTPVAVYALITSRTVLSRVVIGVLLAVSVVPLVFSINRGAWIGIAVAVAYVTLRRIFGGNVRFAVWLSVVLVAMAVVLTATPLQRVIEDRLANENLDTRTNLYSASLQLAVESPLFGHGAPQSSEGLANSNDVSIGTHGQFWTVLVSQGLVGEAIFLAALLFPWLLAWPSRGGSTPLVWLHATGPVLVVETLYYEVIPVPLAVTLISLAVCAAARLRPAHPDRFVLDHTRGSGVLT